MKSTTTQLLVAALAAALATCTASIGAEPQAVPEETVQRIMSALPEEPCAPPQAPRRVLVFQLCQGYAHGCIPVASRAFELMGRKTGAFETVVSTDMKDIAAENLKTFDAILLNNTTQLTFEDPAQREALVEFVRSGKGLIGIHAATDCFYDWPTAALMLGGLFDGHPWGAGGTWAVKIDEPDHPLTASFTGKPFLIKDEIYQIKAPYSRYSLRTLLSLDMSDARNEQPGMKRADRDFAISWVHRFGRGRVFYCSLGHNPEVYWNEAVLRHYLAGIQYALGDLTADDTPSNHGDRARALRDLGAYDFDSDRGPLNAIDALISSAVGDGAALATLEQDLLGILSAPDTSFAARQFVCAKLRVIGTDRSVPALEAMLEDAEYSDMARYALERFPAESGAGRALCGALAQTTGAVRVGIINTLGERREREAVDALARLAGQTDRAAADAATLALGKIGGPAALAALRAAADPADALVARALLRCAEQMAAAGDTTAAAQVYRDVFNNESLALTTRAGAFGALVALEPSSMRTELLEMLGDADPAMQALAARNVRDLPGTDVSAAFAERLDNLPTTGQAVLVSALADRGEAAAVPALMRAARHEDTIVRQAALRGLGILPGNADVVALLGDIAAEASGVERDDARASLTRLSGAGVPEAIIAGAQAGESAQRTEHIQQLAGRGMAQARDVLLAMSTDADLDVRVAALESLRKLAEPSDYAALIAWLCAAAEDAERTAAENTVLAIARRLPTAESPAAPLIAALQDADARTAISLIHCLSSLGGAQALAAVREAANATEEDVAVAAVRGLSAWPDATPLPDLMRIVETSELKRARVLALRGALRLLEIADELSVPNKLERVKTLMSSADSAEDRTRVLAALAQIDDERAVQAAEVYLDNPELSGPAEQAIKRIREQLSGPPRLTASHNNDAAPRAMDGDMSTRWDSGTPMKPGMWFMIDLKATRTIRGLVLDTAESADDYPRGYEVFVGDDRAELGDAIVSDRATSPIIKILPPEPPRGRFIKVVQTGSSDHWFWSIHEVTIDAVE